MLTFAQYEAPNDALLADQDPAVVAALAAQNDTQVANLYNSASATVVWRTSVPLDEIMQNGFGWTRADNLSIGAARVWEWLFNNESRSFNPTKPNVRAGIDAVWKGTAADLAVRASVYTHCKRFASKVEAIFVSGLGTDENPAVLVYEGTISAVDVAIAIRNDDGTPRP